MAPAAPTAKPPALHFLLPTLGSAGDVHPFIALGLALTARGHRATLLTSPLFQDRIVEQGLGFLAIGTREEGKAIVADPNLWHSRKGFEVVAKRAMIPALAQTYELLVRNADRNTIVAASSLALGARVAQEKHGIPTASVHLQPAIIRSLIDQGMAGRVRLSASQPMWFKRLFFHLADWLVIDRILRPPLNALRGSLGLPPVRHVMHRWLHSPQLVIGMYPEWFAPLQPDAPDHSHLVGFPLWDGSAAQALPSEAERFIPSGPPPVVFTAGSATATLPRFFRTSIEAAQRLDIRAILVTDFPAQLPRELPEGVATFRYLPFSRILPQSALFVHHGGIGTTAQAIKAGIPQFVIPNAHDQFDNGWRIERLGLGRSLPQTRYRTARAVATIRVILDDAAMQKRCQAYAARIDSDAALKRACELLETLAPS